MDWIHIPSLVVHEPRPPDHKHDVTYLSSLIIIYPNTSRFVIYLPYSKKAAAIPFHISVDVDIENLENDIRQHTNFKTILEDESLHLFKVLLNSSPIKPLF